MVDPTSFTVSSEACAHAAVGSGSAEERAWRSAMVGALHRARQAECGEKCLMGTSGWQDGGGTVSWNSDASAGGERMKTGE